MHAAFESGHKEMLPGRSAGGGEMNEEDIVVGLVALNGGEAGG